MNKIHKAMKQTNEEKLKRKNDDLKKELELSKKKVKSLASKLSTSERKRKLLIENGDKKKVATYPYAQLNDINIQNL
jgi:predicted RNase H-like nuclease (RuvC/YqgF family)